MYKITDHDGDPIEGTFYEAEIQRVNKSRDDLFNIEKVLKWRRRRGKTEVFVKWQGYRKKINFRVEESELQNI